MTKKIKESPEWLSSLIDKAVAQNKALVLLQRPTKSLDSITMQFYETDEALLIQAGDKYSLPRDRYLPEPQELTVPKSVAEKIIREIKNNLLRR